MKNYFSFVIFLLFFTIPSNTKADPTESFSCRVRLTGYHVDLIEYAHTENEAINQILERYKNEKNIKVVRCIKNK